MEWRYLYLVAAVLLILGLKKLGQVKSARVGNQWAMAGMAVAVLGVLIIEGVFGWWFVLLGLAGIGLGTVIGLTLARRVPLTQMPELVAAFNGFGGLASTLVALGALTSMTTGLTHSSWFYAIVIVLTILIGTVTFTGSAVAYLKLSGKKVEHPAPAASRQMVNGVAGAICLGLGLWMALSGGSGGLWTATILMTIASGVLGGLLVMPIGGADMPVVVALLNSYSGLAASASGFLLGNPLLIVAGALVGASGLILTKIMCKAMNRSLVNVLIGGVGGEDSVAEDARDYTGIKESSPEEVAMLLDAASSVIIVPGYGLAVAQAQHAVRELSDLLEARKVNVRFAIHPVAGRMPGHMNVLLAESDVSYDKLFELEKINSDFKNTDVVIVVGANDVVNPAAREDSTSPIYGMPILDVDQAQTVVVVKRSLSPGYAGIKNPLFDKDNTLMVFMDAKEALEGMITEVKDL